MVSSLTIFQKTMITYIIFRFMNDIRYFGKEKVFTIQDVSMTIQDLDEKF